MNDLLHHHKSERLRVLCVDDSLEVRQCLETIFTLEGFACECVADGRAALEIIAGRTDEPDVVITDLDTPRLDGYALVRELRALNFRGGIIIFSGSLAHVDRFSCAVFDADAVLTKPASPSDLIKAVESAAAMASQRKRNTFRRQECQIG